MMNERAAHVGESASLRASNGAASKELTPEALEDADGVDEASPIAQERAQVFSVEMNLPPRLMGEVALTGDAARSSSGRAVDAWCAWLGALARDAEAALAAAMAYKALDDEGRERWLDVLEQDAARVSVPKIAVYAPLLSVEQDLKRQARIKAAIGPADIQATPRTALRCLSGVVRPGVYVAAIISPLYLNFVQVLACGYDVERGFDWVKHDPIVDGAEAPQTSDSIAGVRLEPTPLRAVVDNLAHAVLAHRRLGKELPDALRIFADLFGQQREPSPEAY